MGTSKFHVNHPHKLLITLDTWKLDCRLNILSLAKT